MNYITREKHDSLSGGSIQPGDLVFCLRGATFGKAARVEPFAEGAIASSLMIIRLFDLHLREYVFAYLKSPLAFDELHKYDNGSAQPNLAAKDVGRYLVPIPPIKEQARIVSKVDELTPLVGSYSVLEDARERLDVELPDRLRKSILQLAVQGKLVEQDPDDEPAATLLDRIRAERTALVKAKKLKAPKGGESIIYRASDGGYYEKRGKGEAVCIDDEIPFDIPENWAWARIRDFGFFSSGKTPSKHDQSLYNGDHLWVTSKDMKSFKITQTGITLSDKGAAGLNTYPIGTMLFVVRSGILKRFLPIAILDKAATINQDIKALTLYYPPIAVGLAYFIKAFEPYILEELTKSVTTVDSLRFDEFQSMLIPVPPQTEWGRIISRLDIALENVITNQ